MSTFMLVAATWLVLGSAFTYVWVTWRIHGNDRRTFQQVLRDRPDWDAELRHLIEQHRT